MTLAGTCTCQLRAVEPTLRRRFRIFSLIKKIMDPLLPFWSSIKLIGLILKFTVNVTYFWITLSHGHNTEVSSVEPIISWCNRYRSVIALSVGYWYRQNQLLLLITATDIVKSPLIVAYFIKVSVYKIVTCNDPFSPYFSSVKPIGLGLSLSISKRCLRKSHDHFSNAGIM